MNAPKNENAKLRLRGEKGPNVFLNAPLESVLELLLPHETGAAQRKQGTLSNNSSFKKRKKERKKNADSVGVCLMVNTAGACGWVMTQSRGLVFDRACGCLSVSSGSTEGHLLWFLWSLRGQRDEDRNPERDKRRGLLR